MAGFERKRLIDIKKGIGHTHPHARKGQKEAKMAKETVDVVDAGRRRGVLTEGGARDTYDLTTRKTRYSLEVGRSYSGRGRVKILSAVNLETGRLLLKDTETGRTSRINAGTFCLAYDVGAVPVERKPRKASPQRVPAAFDEERVKRLEESIARVEKSVGEALELLKGLVMELA
jgi:hypothetical protein